MYRYILRESCSQFDSLPLTSLTRSPRIVGLQSDAISRAKQQYRDEAEKLRKETEESAPRTARGRAAAFQRQEAALTKRVEIAQQALDAAESANEEVATRVGAFQRQIGEVEEYTAKVKRMIAKLEAQESSGPHRESLAALRKLVLLNEQLKAQDSAFRASCASQKGVLDVLIVELRAGGDKPEEAARLLEIDEMHDDVLSKYNKGRALLGRKGQEISALARKIDDIPTRTGACRSLTLALPPKARRGGSIVLFFLQNN